nr:hypothetical protein GCM10020093_025370 [Planobispora longispora]
MAACYGAAVILLAWWTFEGMPGDGIYGSLLMLLLAFPLSMADLLVQVLLPEGLVVGLPSPGTSPSWRGRESPRRS